MRKYNNLKFFERINRAKFAHKNGYDIEAFTIIFECIIRNLQVIVSLETEFYITPSTTYSSLIRQCTKNRLLTHREIKKLNLFKKYRNNVIHNLINTGKIDTKSLHRWFKFGIRVYSDIYYKANISYGYYEYDWLSGR